MIAYIRNTSLMHENHANKRNHWEIYIEEIFHEMGADFEALDVEDLSKKQVLKKYSAVIVGTQSGRSLNEKVLYCLTRFAEEGGLLIGFMTQGLDTLFGIKTNCERVESDPYEISGYFDLLPHKLTRNIHPHTFIEQKLIILSDIMNVCCEGAEKLGCLYDNNYNDMHCSAITWRKVKKGYAAYFAFDVPKTIWVMHQGRPLYTEEQTQVSPRSPDGCVLGHNSRKIPYADEIIYLMQKMLAEVGEAFIYTLPPHEGEVPDAGIIWGGDEYFGPTHWSLFASDFMRSLGLPYHINIESENHPMTRTDCQHITSENGHEISLYVLLDDLNRITSERIKQQKEKMLERFGIEPGCCLFNAVRWYGWAEPARYLAENGCTSVHSKLPVVENLEHPLGNATAFSMNAGTANPFHYYDCAERKNAFISCIELPPVGYELGHNGSVGVRIEVSENGNEHLDVDTMKYIAGDTSSINIDDVHLPIDMAIKYHSLSHFFYHPLYITECKNARKAIHHILSYIDFLEADIYHMANNQAAKWWQKRREAKFTRIRTSDNIDSIKAKGCAETGLIVKMPISRAIDEITIDGKLTKYRIIQDFGEEWLHIVFPPGGGNCKIIYKSFELSEI